MKPTGLHHVRAVLAVPHFASLPPLIQATLAEVSAATSNMKVISPALIVAAADSHFRPLRHELSAHYIALHPPSGPSGRSRVEANVLGDFEAISVRLNTSCPDKFLSELQSINHRLTEGRGGWRRGTVRLADDRAGNQVFFPHVSTVRGQLERVRLLIASRSAAPSLFIAAAAYLALLNCHPFTDGNGRTARVLLNHLMRRGGLPRHVYIPLHEIALRSHGGYEIAVRLAEIEGDWSPFLKWLIDAIRVCIVITAEADNEHHLTYQQVRPKAPEQIAIDQISE